MSLILKIFNFLKKIFWFFFKKKDKKFSDQKNDSDYNFSTNKFNQKKEDSNNQIDKFKKTKNKIFPANNQQRNLDREVGGVEQKESYTTSPKDVWDERTEEIQEMNDDYEEYTHSSTFESIIWRKKQKKKQDKADEIADIAETIDNNSNKNHENNSGGFDSRYENNSFVQKITSLRGNKDDDRNNGGQGRI